MAKQETEFNAAVRTLIESNPELTHKQARPLLEEMGFELAKEKKRQSAELSALYETYEKKSISPELTTKQVAELLEKCKLDPSIALTVLREIRVRDLYDTEANNFNVAASNHRKKIGGDGQKKQKKVEKAPKSPKADTQKKRGRPAGSKNKPKVTPTEDQKKKRGRPVQAKVANGGKMGDITAMIALIQKSGGVKGARQRVAELQAEIAQLESAIKVAEAAVKAAA